MIKAVLFDLDDTLLDINFTAFMTRYVAGLSGLLGDISRAPAPLMGIPFTKAYLAIEDRDRSDDLTNHQLFINKVHALTGIPMDDPAIADAIDCYLRRAPSAADDRQLTWYTSLASPARWRQTRPSRRPVSRRA